MTAVSPPDGENVQPQQGRTSASAVAALIIVLLLLMGFSVCAALLHEATLAVMAGTTAVGLAGETARRALANSPWHDGRDAPPARTVEDTPPQTG